MSGEQTEPGTASESGHAPLGSAPECTTGGGKDTPLEADLEPTVAAYLCAHPDFFERNPQVLAELRVAHESGAAVSLIEHQVNVLRRQLETERSRLSHLISRAREYESLSKRLHGLVLELIPVLDLGQLRAVLAEALSREFSAEAVTLKLFPIDPEATGEKDPLTQELHDFLEREHALCGPLGEDRSQTLFGDLGAEVRSAALIPIRAAGRSGVLAIGAAHPERFKPGMGTDLLDRLGEIVSGKLAALPSAPPSRPGAPSGPEAALGSPPEERAAPHPNR